MRNGTWSKSKNYGEGSKNKPGFPKQPDWFEDARGFKNLEKGLKKVGFSELRPMGYLEIIGIIFIKLFKYEYKITRSKYYNETFKTWIFSSIKIVFFKKFFK